MSTIIWDKPSKESHPNKPLSIHLAEVKSIFERFVRYYDIERWTIELMLEVIRYHDNGKLSPKWSIKNDINPKHSELSIQYMRDMGVWKELKSKYVEHYPLILYLILKHHSALYDLSGSTNEEIKSICRDLIRRLVKRLCIEERIEIIDAFGMFKLADSLSASNNTNFHPIEPKINVNLVKKILSGNRGHIDQKRWAEQQTLKQLSDTALLTAYTGWGKTDSALLFFDGKGVKKVFYLFPTITAINKFHDKLSNYVGGVEKYFYLYEYEMATRYGESQDEAREFSIQAFMISHFLQPIILTTVDQFLLTFLQLGKYYMKRLMFRNAGIVIDEVHLLNPKMLALMLHFVSRFLPIYKFKILFMSATFSDALIQVIRDHLPDIDVMNLTARYKELRRIKYQLDMRKTVLDNLNLILKYLTNGKVLVVMNTVDAAVVLARKLECELNGKYPMLLLHGKFMYKDRIVKEDCIENMKDRPHVLVTTQVCEVSLDASYDALFTEIAPLPSLIQRFGRVNRYGKHVDNTNVYIFKEYRKNNSHRYPYENEDMTNAAKILEELYPLSSEYELLRKYNEVENYNTLARKMDEAQKEVDFRASWECDDTRTAYFFSFKLDEEETKKKLLEFRDEITISMLPHPDCVSGELQNKLDELLKKWESIRSLSYEQANKIFKELRGYLVPIPIWLVKYTDISDRGYPLFRFDNWVYTDKYGFIERG